MSRIGKQPIEIKDGVKIEYDKALFIVTGPKGKLELSIPGQIEVKVSDKDIIVTRRGEDKLSRSLHGTIRMLIHNMIIGVIDGYKKELDILGVGYKAQLKGTTLVLSVGFSHVVEMSAPEGIKITVPSLTHIVIEGIDKQAVGQFAAKVRGVNPPEPYKGKGIRYTGEEVRKKLGKALAK